MAPEASAPNPSAPAAGPQEAAPPAPTLDPAVRTAQAEGVIRRNVFWALGAGVLPLPILDVAAVTAVELKLLKELSAVYGVEFSARLGRKVILSLLASAGVLGAGCLIGGSLAKLIPMLGMTLGFVSVPVLVAAFTHALGRVLLMHFESGGSLLNFDPAAMRAHFQQEFEKGKKLVTELQQGAAAGAQPNPS